MAIEKTDRILKSQTEKLEKYQKEYPEVKEQVGNFRTNLRQGLRAILTEIRNIDQEMDQELMKSLVMNRIYKMTDETLL